MIVITGAAGFIGSSLAARLASNHQLLLVDSEGAWERPCIAELALSCDSSASGSAAWDGANRTHCLLDQNEFLKQLADGTLAPEAIFHLGACSSTTETNWNFLSENNIGYSQQLWNWCTEHHRPFFYASSAATYGDGKQGFDDRTPPEQLSPLNLYGKSKNDFDAWALEQANLGQTPPRWAGLKFFNVYGPRETHKGSMASVVWQAFQQIQQTGEVRLFRSTDPSIPDGHQKRDFVFVEDCVDHMIWLWQNDAPNAIYNSGTGQARTFLDLVHAVFDALNAPRRIKFIDTPAHLAKQYQNYTQAEMSKLQQAGYTKPATSLETGVRHTVAGYQQLLAVATG